VELDHDTDCIGSVTAFKYVIPAGRIEAMETGAALLMGARDGPPVTTFRFTLPLFLLLNLYLCNSLDFWT
jgi:hypothetical protein